jgi:hypothetical protein
MPLRDLGGFEMFRRRVRALLAAGSVFISVAVGSVLPASAHTTDGVVNASHCFAAHGGATTVDAGSRVEIRVAWGTQLLGDHQTFLGAQSSIASWNDGPWST